MADDLPTATCLSDDSSDGRSDVTIVICVSCRFPGQDDASPRPGAGLAEATRPLALAAGMEFRRTACLGNCKRGLSAAILREGCWSYIFGDLTLEHADDIVAGATLLGRSSDGFMPYRERPEALKSRLIARIPSSINLEDLPK